MAGPPPVPPPGPNPVTSKLRSRVPGLLLAALPTVFLAYFFVYPLVRILWRGLGGDDLSGFRRVLGDADFLGVAWFTFWQAALSTILTLLVALPGAYVFARYSFRGKSLLRAAITVPFVLPTVVVGSAFLALLGDRGVLGLGLDGTLWSILLAHVFYNYPIVVRTVGGLWSHLDPRTVEAARMLGATRLQAFTEVTLPLLRPALAAAASIVFLFTFTSFGVILILGGARYATLEVEIFRQTTSFLNLEIAAALAVLQLVGVTAILAAYSRYQERHAVAQDLQPAAVAARPPRSRGERAFVGGNLAFMGLLLGVPLGVLVERSFRATSGGYGLDAYRALDDRGRALFVAPAEAIGNSLAFAGVAALMALVIGLSAAVVVAYRRGAASRWFDTLLMLPLGTSAVTIGFGFLIALDTPIDLRTSAALVPIAHALVAIPFVVRSVVPLLRSVRERLREAAAVLGASPGRVWREIDLPIIARAAAVALGFAFAVSIGEFGATSFVVRPDAPTVPIAIFRYLSQPGPLNFASAMAMSTILMLITAAGVLAIDRFRPPGLGDF